jgi:hypothetical protein
MSHFRIVQCPGTYKNQMRPGFGFAKKLCTADATKPPMHSVTAISDALKIGEFTFDGDRFGRKAGIDRPAAGSEVLAETTPTHSRYDRCRTDSVTHGTA